jgi:hypothetical protein
VTDIAVAIPSHGRSSLIIDKTLSVLHRTGVPPEAITVWVADHQERDAYMGTMRNVLDGGADRAAWYAEVDIKVAAPGLVAARNVIASHYDTPGTWLVQMDDDVDDVRRRVSDKAHEPVGDLMAFWQEMFGLTADCGLRLWGVYPVLNPMFMRPKVTTDLRLCVGPMFGMVRTADDSDVATVAIPGAGEKEDHERTLRYFCADGGVVRCGFVAVKTKFYRPDGGIHAAGRTVATERAAVDYLLANWPEYVRERPPRKAGFPEVRLVGPK